MTYTILYAEDEVNQRTPNARLLEIKKGYKVIQAESREKAIALFDQYKNPANNLPKIDLLLTDCDMEENYSGFELISDIRKRGSGIPVILITGAAGGEEEISRRNCLASLPGNNSYLRKPAMSDEIINEIERMVSLPQRQL